MMHVDPAQLPCMWPHTPDVSSRLAVSSVFKQEIEQQQGLNGRPTICMDVEDDQVPAASALVRFVYTGGCMYAALLCCISLPCSRYSATSDLKRPVAGSYW
jgi:hypothetical protein